jgi:hypothetical protein
MPRFARTINLATGAETLVPFTPEEEAAADAAAEAEQARLSEVVADKNGAALDTRQRKTAKDEAAALAKSGDLEAAFHKILELIPT